MNERCLPLIFSLKFSWFLYFHFLLDIITLFKIFDREIFGQCFLLWTFCQLNDRRSADVHLVMFCSFAVRPWFDFIRAFIRMFMHVRFLSDHGTSFIRSFYACTFGNTVTQIMCDKWFNQSTQCTFRYVWLESILFNVVSTKNRT